MPKFKYTAKNAKTDDKVSAEVVAENEKAAAKLISDQGLTPINITPERSFSLSFNRIRTKDKVLFSRQLATLINAGLPLVQSLENVEHQTGNKKLKSVIKDVSNDVQGGLSLSKALAKHPTVFNRVYLSLIEASETSGTLDKGLERLANQQEKDADIVSKVRGALIYPGIVMAVMALVVIFMVVKVLPEVQSIYAGLPGVSLPLPTRLLLFFSQLFIHFWWLIVALIIAFFIFYSRWARTLGGREVIDKIKMKAWPFGHLYMKVYMARFSRTGATLIGSGVPLIQMLDITADAVDNVYVERSINKAIEKVKAGKSLSESLEKDPNFLELVPQMLGVGEKSGAMETMLEKVADYYEKEVDQEIKNISTLIEPVMMIIIGIIALTIVAAILLPIYGLVNQSGFTNNV